MNALKYYLDTLINPSHKQIKFQTEKKGSFTVFKYN